ncbi:MAG: DUF4234 domain-containing protein [Eubacterium sp.]|nr:DUF4234 domain-containing protein [Candidatus Colimonas fimequi]
MNNYFIIGREKVVYIIAAVVLILQGLCSLNLVSSGASLISYAMDAWFASEIQMAWGIFCILSGLLASAGFICIGIGAFMRNKFVVGIGSVIVVASYLASILREIMGSMIYGEVGFVFLNILCMAIMVFVALMALGKIDALNDFVTRYNVIAALIPVALLAVTLTVAIFESGLTGTTVFYNTVETAGQVAAVIVASALLAGVTKDNGGFNVNNNAFDTSKSVQAPEGYRNVALVIIFTIITCGIYSWYWVYKVSELLNKGLNNGKSSGVQTVLFIFVPFYSWYWYYTQTKNAFEYGMTKGVRTDEGLAFVNIILCIVGFAIVAMGLMQDMINKIVGENEGSAYSGGQQSGYQNRGYQAGNYQSGGYGAYTYVQPQQAAPQAAPQAEPQQAATEEPAPEPQAAPEAVEPEATFTSYEEVTPYEDAEETIVAEPEEVETADDKEVDDIIENLQMDLQMDVDTYDDPIEQFVEQSAAKPEEAAETEAAAGEEKVPYEQLKRLKELLDEDIITQAEFDQLKQKFIK